MVLRSVIGALVAVGVMGAIAAALPERNAGMPMLAAPPPAFGNLAAPNASPAPHASGFESTSSGQDRQSLVNLASYPGAADGTPAKGQTVVSTASPPPAAAAAPPAPVVAPAPKPAPAPVRTVAITNTAPPPPVPDPPVAVQPPPAPERANGLININRASIAQLDHIPGGGRIGAWIARRRPYRSIEDLLKKRVLREAAFQRIRNAITAD